MGYYFGKSVDNAIEIGLKDLGVTKDQVEITVIEEAVKGFLGIGGKDAKIKMEVKVDDCKRASDFLDGLFEKLNVTATTEVVEDGDRIVLNVVSTSSSYLIGHRGEMLDALQTLAGAVANIGNDEYKRVVVDCENYRSKREETLKALAIRLANKAIKYQRTVSLEPMNPFERRLIHTTLNDIGDVETKSEGEGLYKQVRVIYKGIR